MSEILSNKKITSSFERDSFSDGLEEITGLVPVIQRWLKESFNVQKLEDLASLSVDHVLTHPALSRLEDERKVICKQKLNYWISQAQRLMVRNASWCGFATFVVSIQSRQVRGKTEQRTIAYSVEANRSIVWSGIAGDAVQKMMLNQLEQIFQVQREAANPMKPNDNYDSEAIAKHPSDGHPNTSSGNTTPSDDVELVDEPEPIAGNSTAAELFPENLGEAPDVTETVSEAMGQPLAVVGESDATPGEPPPVGDEPPATADQPDAGTYESLAATHEPAPNPMQASSEDLPEEWEPEEPDVEEASDTGAAVEPQPVVEVIAPLALQITQIKFCQEVETEVLKDEASQTFGSNRVEAKAKEKTREEIQVQMEGRSLSKPLQKSEPFDLEVTFQITGQGAVELAERSSPYYFEVYIWNLETEEFFSLGRSSVRSLQPPELAYTSQLKNAVLEKTGSYRIQIVTKIVGSALQPVLFELPSVQVH